MPDVNQTSDDSLDDAEFDKAFNAAAAEHGVDSEKPFVVNQEDDDEANEEDEGKAARQAADPVVDTRKAEPDSTQELAALKARLAAAEHRIRSDDGRVAALQRKLDEELKATRTKQAGGASPGSEIDTNDDSFGEEFSEVADFVQRAVEKQVGPIKSAIEEQRAAEAGQREQLRIADAFQKIAEVHPDFDQIRSDPEYPKWLNTQAPMVVRMAGSEDPADAIALCGLYKASKGNQRPSSRQELIAAAEEIPSKGGSRKTGVPDDYESAFDHYASELLRKNQR